LTRKQWEIFKLILKIFIFRKRYERAEAEYINAKVSLHDKTEIKDQLTEHLCSIIQQNEERKAKKLAELMTRLELADQEMNLETDESISEDSKEKTLPQCTETESSNGTLMEQKTVIKKVSETLSEPDKKSNEPEGKSLKQDSQIQSNNNGKIEQEQKTVEKSEPDLVEVKEASVEKT
jgi:RAB6-interacting golgin